MRWPHTPSRIHFPNILAREQPLNHEDLYALIRPAKWRSKLCTATRNHVDWKSFQCHNENYTQKKIKVKNCIQKISFDSLEIKFKMRLWFTSSMSIAAKNRRNSPLVPVLLLQAKQPHQFHTLAIKLSSFFMIIFSKLPNILPFIIVALFFMCECVCVCDFS